MKNAFRNKKVLVMGLGLHGGGISAAKFFYKNGADVSVTDLKTLEQLKDSVAQLKGLKIKYTLGEHKEEDFLNADLIIKNPDVPGTSPYLEIARKNNVAIETDVSLFLKLSKAYVIGITGTKGKSTVSAFIYHIVKAKYRRTFLGGNIGVSPLSLLFKLKKGDRVVLELSSFELEDLKTSPNIAVVTNILPDHLNRYGVMSEYIEAKKIIFKYQKKSDVLILNYDDPVVRDFSKKAKSKCYFYSAESKPRNSACFLDEKKIYFANENKPVVDLKIFKLPGKHNVLNLLAAVSTAKILKMSPETIRKAVKSFKGVHSRQQFIREVEGVKYFNDTTATMPDAVIVAIKSFTEKFSKSKIILIAGGQDKKLDYDLLAKEIKENIYNLVLLPGTASEILKKEIGNWAHITEVASMQEAVKKASYLANRGDVVLLSPSAASFNLFKNEFDRGEQFVKAVKKL